jgi:hypothetical protein
MQFLEGYTGYLVEIFSIMSSDFIRSRRTSHPVLTTMTIRHRHWYLAILLGIGTLLLIAAAGCRSKSGGAQAGNGGFLGNAACAACHANEFDMHRASHHAVTMRPVDRASMGSNWPNPGAIQGTDLVLYQTRTGVALGWQGKEADAVPLQFALGSDRFGFTYIHIVDNRTLMELRESYYPPIHSWLSTPGQDFVAGDLLGRSYNEDISRHCLGCHVTTLPADRITPEPRFYGVGCESCHGPGQKHVEAVRAGVKTDLHMEKLGSSGATKLNELCGRCHRTARDVPADDADMTQRFEPYGLMKSRCFLESDDTLSCATCHNPHTDASADQKGYEKVCLNCHTPAGGYGPANPRRKPCPVNPRRGCIPCHMPERNLTVNAPFAMTDHFIHVFP